MTRYWEVMLEWEQGDLLVMGYRLQTGSCAATAAFWARGLTAMLAKLATMQVKVLRVRRLDDAEFMALQVYGLVRPWAVAKTNLREFPGSNQEQEEKA